MSNLEENLSKIKVKELTEEDKQSLWSSIIIARVKSENEPKRSLSINIMNEIMNLSMKKWAVLGVLGVMVFGSTGVVAASNSSRPGDFLFPVELAVEKLEIKFAGEDKKEELRVRFAMERAEEVKAVSKDKKSTDDEGSERINFSVKEEEDISTALTEIEVLLDAGVKNNQDREELKQALDEVLKLLGDEGKIDIRKDGTRIKIETKDNKNEIKIEIKKDNSGSSNDDNGREDDSSDDDKNDDSGRDSDDDKNSTLDANLNVNLDVKEDDSEVFCRGEWRDPEDCDDSEDSDDNKDDDHSGQSGKDDSDDDDSSDDSDNSDSNGGGDDN